MLRCYQAWPLKTGACYLWYWRPDSLASALSEQGLAFLSDDEIARYRRFVVPEPARTFLAARVLLRSVLSAYCPVDPREWRFAANPWGRPYIVSPEPSRQLVFNLSDKPGFIACLVGWNRELGVDVEDASVPRNHWLPVAQRFFSSSEFAGLQELEPGRQLNRFYQLWTLKESYVKARGRGLSLGLSRFSFSVAEDTATIRFEPGFEDDPEPWDFRFFRPTARHLIATAVKRPAGTQVSIEMADATRIVAARLSRPPLI